MGMLPQTNATLTAISTPGFSADGDQPATAGTNVWSGVADAYLDEGYITSTAAGRRDLFQQDRLIIPGDLVPHVDVAAGQTVTFAYAGKQQTRVVAAVTARLMAGMLPTVRLDLQDQ